MNAEQFRQYGKEMVDNIADYLETMRDRPGVCAQVQPGYLKDLIPGETPLEPETWMDVCSDIERVIMPGITHWQSSNFHAYFPAGSSYPVIIADMLINVLGVSTTEMVSPVDADLEVKVMDWLANMMNLPKFYHSSGNGKGILLGSASEATLIGLLAAKQKAVEHFMENNAGADPVRVTERLVMYCSDEAHSSVERAALLTSTRLHKVESDSNSCLRGDALQAAILEDIKEGLLPFYFVASMGTTSSCAIDNLSELGPICKEAGIWIHVDAAYAGAALICPEFQYLCNQLEYTDSFDINPCKWLLTNYDISALWLKHPNYVCDVFDQTITRNKSESGDSSTTHFWNYGIPVTRRFRALKLWFLCRLYGISGLQNHIRNHVLLAKQFEELLSTDERFELFRPVTHGMVCFRLKGDNELSRSLLMSINCEGLIHMVPAESKGIYYLRFVISIESSRCEDVEYAWKIIVQHATKLESAFSNQMR